LYLENQYVCFTISYMSKRQQYCKSKVKSISIFYDLSKIYYLQTVIKKNILFFKFIFNGSLYIIWQNLKIWLQFKLESFWCPYTPDHDFQREYREYFPIMYFKLVRISLRLSSVSPQRFKATQVRKRVKSRRYLQLSVLHFLIFWYLSRYFLKI